MHLETSIGENMTDTLENLIAEQNQHAASSTLTDEDNVVTAAKLSDCSTWEELADETLRIAAPKHVDREQLRLPRLTKDQAIVLTAYTGVVHGDFEDFAAACEKRLGRPIFSDPYYDYKSERLTGRPLFSEDYHSTSREIQKIFRKDFFKIQPE